MPYTDEVTMTAAEWEFMAREQGMIPPANNGLGLQNRAGTLGTANAATNYQMTGGIFARCDLERPVLNITLQPTRSLANMIPYRFSNVDVVTYAYLTAISNGSITPQDTICEIPPQPGDISVCFASYARGRLEFATQTMEPHDLIRKAHKGVQDDLYFVGDIRGVLALQDGRTLLGANGRGNLPLIQAGAIRRQMQYVGRLHQRYLLHRFWYGDPDAVGQNGAGGGWKSFWGMNSMIANDYGSKAWVTGTSCTQLNSEVINFASGVIGSSALYSTLQDAEANAYNKAQMYGTPIEEAVIVMHPILWDQWVKFLPCEMINDSCAVIPASSDTIPNMHVNDGGGGMYNLTMRRQLQTQMSLTLNGRSYNIVLDDTLALTTAGSGPVTYDGTIYFIPTRVAGEQTIFWDITDYREFYQQLPPIDSSVSAALGWTDGGIYHWVIERDRGRCFLLRGLIEPGLVYRTPHLAFRVDAVRASVPTAKPKVTVP